LLDIFKQNRSFLTRAKEKSYIKYVLLFENNQAHIQIQDKNDKSLSNLDYRVYNGIDRKILQYIDEISQKDFFEIDWSGSSDKIYLESYHNLIELFKKCENFFYENKQISYSKSDSKVVLNIEEVEDKIYIKSVINNSDDFKFLTSEYIILNNEIIKIEDIGEKYSSLKLFDTSLQKQKLEEILTIIATNYVNIDFEYKDFEFKIKDEPKLVKPTIIFEKINSENELILKVSATLGNISAEFFSEYSITKLVSINEYEKKIYLHEADFSEVFEIYSTLYKNLTSLKKSTKSNFSEDEGLFIIEQDLAKEYIQKYLPTIVGTTKLYGSNKLKAYNYSAQTPRINVNFGEKIDFLGVNDIEVSIGDDSFDIVTLLNLYKKNSYIPLSDGNKAIVDEAYINKIQRLFKKDKSGIKISFFDLPEIEELVSQKEQKVFKKSKDFYTGFEKLKTSKKSIPKLNDVKLRDYQKYGIKWLMYLYDNNFGGCLADDMGLGKTLQAIGLLSYIYPKSKKQSLIVVPKSLLNNWQNELSKYNPSLKYSLYYGTNRDFDELKDKQIIITTYALVRNDIEILKEKEFDTIIVDESQNMKNIDSQISKAVILLNAKHKFALSGTPIENSLFELYSLFRFINIGMFGTQKDFKSDYMAPISQNIDEVAQSLRSKISPFILRRLKNDVLKDLPAKQESVIYVDMNQKQKEFYESKRRYYKEVLLSQVAQNGIESSRFAIFSALSELRQIASLPTLKSDIDIESSKIESLFEMLEDIVANNHKVLIFANFIGVLDAISQKADEIGFNHLVMTGSTKDRQAIVDKFQNSKDYSLLLMTLKVGGVGLNLTSADYVFIFDPWWNKSAENQAVDRAHRMGQKNKVFSYKMITKDTIEEKIIELQNKKTELSDKIISDDESGLKQISEQDLDYLLG
jgi:SNF2 family DNA or RNA helicase